MTGVVSVSDCAQPGKNPCLDYEFRNRYDLTVVATDNRGTGLSRPAALVINVLNVNDNPPRFSLASITRSIDELKVVTNDPLILQVRITCIWLSYLTSIFLLAKIWGFLSVVNGYTKMARGIVIAAALAWFHSQYLCHLTPTFFVFIYMQNAHTKLLVMIQFDSDSPFFVPNNKLKAV